MKLKNVKVGLNVVVKDNYTSDNVLIPINHVAKQGVTGMTATVVDVNESHVTEKVQIKFDSCVDTQNAEKTWWVPHSCIKPI